MTFFETFHLHIRRKNMFDISSLRIAAKYASNIKGINN